MGAAEEEDRPVAGALLRELDSVLRQFETNPNRGTAVDMKAAVALILAAAGEVSAGGREHRPARAGTERG